MGDFWPSDSSPSLETSVLCDILITMKNDRRNILYFPSFFFFFYLLGYKAEVFHHNQLYETADGKL
jgi:hypothetical protein